MNARDGGLWAGASIAAVPLGLLTGALLAAAPLSGQADVKVYHGSERDYVLHCSGCHSMDGSGHPEFGVPDFRDQVGYFLRLPEGRAFLMQVPGLMNAGLPDARRAEVTNYVVTTFAGSSLPRELLPYTAEEAKRYAENRPADVATRRRQLYEQLNGLGYAVSDPMLKKLAKLLSPPHETPSPVFQQHALEGAVATLLYEMTRMDSEVKAVDLAAARAALADLFGLEMPRADALLDEAAHKAGRITSYFAQVSVINRRFEMAERIRFVEHLWRVAYADGGLDQYEDHLVRKISNLLYVPHVQCMLARQRARGVV